MDLAMAHAHLLAADPVLAALMTAVGPYTLRLEPQGFAALIDAIVSQQISVKAADTILQRVTVAAGELTPAALLALPPEALRAAGLSGQKVRYVHDLATKVEAGVVDLEQLPLLDDEAIIQQLIQVKGIGRWTAEMYLIFSLGRPDVLPVDDLGIRQGIQRAYNLPTQPTVATMRAIATPWQPYRSMASWYLWRSLQLPRPAS